MFNISKWFRRRRNLSPSTTVVASADIAVGLEIGSQKISVTLSARFYIEDDVRKISYSSDYVNHDPSKIICRIDHVAHDWLKFGTELPDQITFPDSSYTADIKKMPISKAECSCMSRWNDVDEEKIAAVAKVHGDLTHVVSMPAASIGGLALSDEIMRWMTVNVGANNWRYLGITSDGTAWLSFREASTATMFKMKFG
jgi:hypothetical protein